MSEEFVIETAADGTPIRYFCEQLMSNNQANWIEIEYYYDILHSSDMDVATAVADGESALLTSVAKHFGLIDGARCSVPPTDSLWVTDVTSRQQDEPEVVFANCLELTPAAGQSCSVYKGYMEAHYFGEGDESEFQAFIQQNLNNVGGDTIQIAYLGAQLDSSVVSNPVNTVPLDSTVVSTTANGSSGASASKAETMEGEEKPNQEVTFVGGLLVAALLAAFLALFFVLYRRRQKFLAAQEMEMALSKSDMDDISPDGSSKDVRPENIQPEIGSEEDEDFPTNYRFDLATSMKNELFNIHGRAADAPKSYGIGIEETSDSDADSWAQTDGTIGSLELQLEPITAEV